MDRTRSYQLGMYEKATPFALSWEQRLRACREAGFDYLELSIDETEERRARLQMSEAERLELRQWSERLECPFGSICLSAHRKFPLGARDANVRRQSMELLTQTLDLASALGIGLIQLAGYDVYYEEGGADTEAYFAENLERAADLAAKYGISLGFETMETPFMDTVEKAMHYVERIGSAHLGVYPDIGNLKNASLLYGNSVNEDLRKGRGHLFAAHLKETVPGKYREIPFGTGHTEFVSNVEVLKQLHVRRFVGEFWHVGEADWREELQKASTFLRGHLDSVFAVEA